MNRSLAVLALVAAVAGPASAQRPTVSPALLNLVSRDTIVTVWLFADRGRDLQDAVRLVRNAGGELRHRSRWLHAVSARLPAPAIRLLLEREELRHIQPVAQFRGRYPFPGIPASRGPLPTAYGASDSLYGPSAMPFRQLNLFPLVDRNVRGTGVTIALLDTGFETLDPAFGSATVIAQRDFVYNDSVVRNDTSDGPTPASQHGTAVWSLLAANIPNQLIGIAPDADYVLAKTEDVRSETRVEEDNYVAALEWADSLGADVVSSSLSYLGFDDGFAYSPDSLNGDVAVTSVAADSAVARGIVVVTAAGNSGAQGFRSIGSPADGDSVITVGAEDSLGTLQSFSSRGPTADGRLKPDVTAPGHLVYVLNRQSATGFSRFSGTSFSTPIVAGTAALLREIHPLLDPVEIRDALRRSGSNRAAPDSSSGWGRPDANNAATFPRGIRLIGPGDAALNTVTPRFGWLTRSVPTFGQPVSYRLRVARDAAFTDLLLDTTLAGTEVQLVRALRPGTRFRFAVEATAANAASADTAADTEFTIPPWATLLAFDDPAGTTIREVRPTFRWRSPEVVSPPGPFTYDVAVLRAETGGLALIARELTATELTPTRDLERNTPYRWRVISHLGADSTVTESRGTFVIVDESTPTATLLFQNFPNPFPNRSNGLGTTCIWFDLATSGRVRLDILDIRGHVVRNLVPGAAFSVDLPPGRYGRAESGAGGQCDPRLEWDGRGDDGAPVPRGVYVIKLDTPDGTLFRRVVFLGAAF